MVFLAGCSTSEVTCPMWKLQVPHVETAGSIENAEEVITKKKKEKDVGKRSLVQMVARAHELARRLTFSFFGEIPVVAGNEISAEISPNFANSERKENSNSKNEISVISTEISVIFLNF